MSIRVNNVRNFDSTVTRSVIDGKLVLVKCKSTDTFVRCYTIMKIEIFKPIIISETEKIKVGDIFYDTKSKSIHKAELAAGLFHTRKKILVLPEHFTQEQLQMIVDGKLKDGDKVAVECYKYNEFKGGAGEQSGYYIQFNPHITLHRVEEKMYTREEVRNFFIEIKRELIGRYDSDYFHFNNEWFEQNVK